MDNLIQKMQQFIGTCPKFSERDLGEWNEKATAWCDGISLLIAELYGNQQHGAKIREWMNHSILLLQLGRPGREAYDNLVESLIEGYRAIEKGAPPDVRLSGPVIKDRAQITRSRPTMGSRRMSCSALNDMRASKYAVRAIEIIESELRNPFTLVPYIEFDEECSIDRDPIVNEILHTLQQAKSNLDRNILAAGIHPRRTTTALDAATARTPWMMAWGALTTVLYSQEAQESIPWVWLGVAATNSHNFRLAHEALKPLSLTPRQQSILGQSVSRVKRRWRSSDFIDTICAALSHAKNALELLDRHFLNTVNATATGATATFLQIDVNRCTAIYMGREYELSPPQAEFLSKLNEEPGVWILGKHLGLDKKPTEISRLKRELPPSLNGLVDSNTRKGYRLRIPR